MNSFAIPSTGQNSLGRVNPELPDGLGLPGLLDPSADTHRCLCEVVDTFKGQTRLKRIQVSLQFLARDYRLTRSPERLRQVFSSLMRSAVGSAPAGSQITIRSTCPGEGALRIEVVEHRRGRPRRQPMH